MELFWIVWTRSWPDPSRIECALVYLRGSIPREPKLIKAYEVAQEHRHYALGHLKTMECYALPAEYKGPIEQNIGLDASKSLSSKTPLEVTGGAFG